MKAARDQTEFNQYKTYVSHMVFAYDEILRINDETEWHDTFDYDLSFHMRYICDENDPRFYKTFYKRTPRFCWCRKRRLIAARPKTKLQAA